MSYLEFMAPGVLAQGVLFTAIFYGIAVISTPWASTPGAMNSR